MAQQPTDQHSDSVVAAIEHVLGAERDGEARLRDIRQHAEGLLAAARLKATAIARRADARISRLHASYLQKIQQDIEQLAGPQAPAAEAAESTYAHSLLRDVTRSVAAKLTGET